MKMGNSALEPSAQWTKEHELNVLGGGGRRMI